VLQGTWLDTAEYRNYRLVAMVSPVPGAEAKPRTFSAADLVRLTEFMEAGGAFLMGRGAMAVFASPEGRDFLEKLADIVPESVPNLEILLPQHPWVKHLDPKLARRVVKVPDDLRGAPTDGELAEPPKEVTKVVPLAYLAPGNVLAIRAKKGEALIGRQGGGASLYRLRVGKGQFIYVGWRISDSLPPGRSPSSFDQDALYEQQFQILGNILAEIYPGDAPSG
jgi:hypothetical protein